MLMILGTELRRLRKVRHETLTEVSDKTGIAVSSLSTIERGRTSPTIETLQRLARYYQVPIQQLLEIDAAPSAEMVAKPLPGFSEFVGQMNGHLSEDIKSLLLHVNAKAKQPAQDIDDWRRYYYTLASIIN